MSFNDPTGSGFHSQSEKDNNRKLRDQIDSLSKNFTGTDAWGAGQSYADGVYGGGKYEDNLMNDEYLSHMIGYLEKNQKTAQAPAAKPKPKPVQLSKEVATAIGRSQAYQDTLRDGDYVIAGDKSGIDDFNNQTEQNIKEALKPYFERDVDPKYAQSYADKHKLMLGDDFSLTKIA